MRRTGKSASLAIFAFAVPAICLAQVQPPGPGQIGTTEIFFGTQLDGSPRVATRVGIVAYCADIAPNAGTTGLQAGKRSIKDGFAKSSLQEPFGAVGHPWFLDGPFDVAGQFGAQNLADYLFYDDGIDRSADIAVIDGDRVQPTAAQLIRDFDVVVAYTDNKCGIPIPGAIAIQAANALAGFIAAPNKGLILTGFAFSTSIGFGNSIFGAGLSPLRKGGPAVDASCTRDAPCPVGVCPDVNPATGLACSITGDPPECLDTDGNVCTRYQPLPPTTDFACDHMLAGVKGPTSSSWVTELAPATVAPDATLCFNYDGPVASTPYLAINARRNIVALNTFPGDAKDIQKFWYACIIGNAIEYVGGSKNRCNTFACR